MLVVVSSPGRNVVEVARAIEVVALEHSVVVTGDIDQLEPELLRHELTSAVPSRRVVILSTPVVVRVMPVGPHYVDTPDAKRFVADFGWMVIQDATGFRRCVPAPDPQIIHDAAPVIGLVKAGVVVICAFRPGMAITEAKFGMTKAEAKIDPDLAAALLGGQIGADLLLLLTDDELIAAEPLPSHDAIRVAVLRNAITSFAPKLIGQKVEAACRFVESTGRRAAIGTISRAHELVRGAAGIQVTA